MSGSGRRRWNGIEKDAARAINQFQKEGQTEAAAAVRQLLSDAKDALLELAEPLSMEGFIDYFTPRTESFPDYFDPKRTLIFLDEPNRLLESADAVELEFRESMEHRLEKGYVLNGQTGILFSGQEIAARISRENAIGLCTLENAKAPFTVIWHLQSDGSLGQSL